jgi:hypothetical protein
MVSTAWMQTADDDGTIRGAQLGLPVNVEQTGELRCYRFTLPFLPPSKNMYDNWPGQWKQSAKKKWLREIAGECEASMVPKGLVTVGLAATLVFPSRRRRDPQNYAQALWHWVPDALVRCGVLRDDCEGRVQIGANWGIRFAYDMRDRPKRFRERTVLALTCMVSE